MSISDEERLRVLKLVQDGKISADDAASLLQALEGSASQANTAQPENHTGDNTRHYGKWMRVKVTDMDTGKTSVNIRLPINLMRAGMKLGKNFAPELVGLDIEDLINLTRSEELGQVVDIYDDEDRERVEVTIE